MYLRKGEIRTFVFYVAVFLSILALAMYFAYTLFAISICVSDAVWPLFFSGAICWLCISTNEDVRKKEKCTAACILTFLRRVVILVIAVILCASAVYVYHYSTAAVSLRCFALFAVLIAMCRGMTISKTWCRYIAEPLILAGMACTFFYADTMIYSGTFDIVFLYAVTNVLIIFAVELGLWLLLQNFKISAIASVLLNVVWLLVHQYVYLCRGTAFQPSDIASAATAMEVVSGYDLTIDVNMWAFLAAAFVLILLFSETTTYKKSWKQRVVLIFGLALLLIGCRCWYEGEWVQSYGLTDPSWDLKLAYDNRGFTMGFVEVARRLHVEKPDGYSTAYAEEILEAYESDAVTSETKPNIIVVMNESFARLDDVGEVSANKEYMPFYVSMETGKVPNTVTGRMLVSAYGGNTCNSEYEFLTGNSLEMTPFATPYASEITKNLESVVTVLQAQGYETTAMHAMNKKNWRRGEVYRFFQFDNALFYDDFKNLTIVHGLPSDQSGYENVIAILKDAADPQFVFFVTVQNHGGYIHSEETYEIQVPGDHEEVNEYLSTIYASDQAFEELVAQVDSLEQPTILVAYGDHYPMLYESYYDEIRGREEEGLEDKQTRYATPYFVHANYETSLDAFSGDMSLNYLGSDILQQCGLSMSAYQAFLLQMQQTIPEMNKNGYKGDDGNWYAYTDETAPEEYRDLLTEYNILQYYVRYDGGEAGNSK